MSAIERTASRSDRFCHAAFALFAATLTAFSIARAHNPDRWSDWEFGDAQTMLSLEHWQRSGWLANHLLFIPQGYASFAPLLDEPQLRHHAHGISKNSSPEVGPRLWYTHYPAGYLIPFALVHRFGADSLFATRLVAIALSIAGLAFLYAFFVQLSTPLIALLAAITYGSMPTFLGYTDALANQPIDDCLRFAFLCAISMAARAPSEALRKRWTLFAWSAEFALSLCSFDSVFFLFLWLLAFDAIERRGFRIKRYALFALAPLLAHGLQYLQNVAYLGAHAAWRDVVGTFIMRSESAASGDVTRFDKVTAALHWVTANGLVTPGLTYMLAALYVLYKISVRPPSDAGAPSLAVIFALFVCGCAIVAVLPGAAMMWYQGRQVAPAFALLVGGALVSLGHAALVIVRSPKRSRPMVLASVYLLLALPLFNELLTELTATTRGFIHERRPLVEEHELARELARVRTPHDAAFFSLKAFKTFWDPEFAPGHPQIAPNLEYYAGKKMILCFEAAPDLARDVRVLLARAGGTFSPVLVAKDRAQLDEVVRVLQADGTLTPVALRSRPIRDRFYVDLSSAVASR